MLVIASYVFYGAWDWRFLSLLLASTTVDFFVGRYLGREPDPRRRRAALVASLVFNLGMLGFFKYFNFFAASLAGVFELFGWRADFVTLNVLLPIGISFYTFMTISYVVDVYRRDIEPETHFTDFALFVAYFPHLVAGPILRASLLLPQIRRPRVITSPQLTEGAWLIGWGYFQKMFLADTLAPLVENAFGPGTAPTGVEVLVAVYAFAFQIFGDFAGYSNIARGVSKLMGIELNINFRFPYFVASPQAFWRHWHISLSTWLRDYLYIPLGGNRGTAAHTSRNLMLTMVLGGLWHGAAWTFVLWGLFQGVVLVIARIVQALARRRRIVIPEGLNWRRALVVIVMFHVTCLGWLIFRAESLTQIGQMLSLVVHDFHLSPTTVRAMIVPVLLAVVPFLLVHVYQARHDDDTAVLRLPWPVQYAVYGMVFYLVVLFGDFEGAQFIYFQF
jgi:D-alanyl-lipoteichoic acid acyltransferase DltB (MBOAT superfamily)